MRRQTKAEPKVTCRYCRGYMENACYGSKRRKNPKGQITVWCDYANKWIQDDKVICGVFHIAKKFWCYSRGYYVPMGGCVSGRGVSEYRSTPIEECVNCAQFNNISEAIRTHAMKNLIKTNSSKKRKRIRKKK